MSDKLWNISPLDGRYSSKIEHLAQIASEAALIRYRIQVEVEWYIALSEAPEVSELDELSVAQKSKLRTLYHDFSSADAKKVKEIETVTNHDVKAVEYFLKEKAIEILGKENLEFFHFACTSEDINSTAYALMLKDLNKNVTEQLKLWMSILSEKAIQWKEIPVLCRTHGQPASSSILGKEILVFQQRVKGQLDTLQEVRFRAKMSGAVGNFNAHVAAYPEVDWLSFSRDFLENRLGLSCNEITTQIEPHDEMAVLFDNLSRIASIAIDFARDIWLYISFDYFAQQTKAGEVGSSTMPHKVNPIDFENAEGNFMLARNLFRFLADKLPVSRLQRDLTDSTVLRNIGLAYGYFAVALKSLIQGMDKLKANTGAIAGDLDNHWEILAEPIQTVMKRYGIKNPYEQLKVLTRGQKIDREILRKFIDQQELPADIKDRLLKLTPATYTGIASELINNKLL